MNTAPRTPDSDPLYVRPLPQRPFYATGMLLGAQDFSDEQTYHRGRLAEAIAFLSGGGTLAGLRVTYQAAAADGSSPEQIQVEPGVAVDRLGRLVEIPRPACLRLQRWFDATQAIDSGDTLRRATYDHLERFLTARLLASANRSGVPPVPTRAVVGDVFLRFVACAQGLTPSFASGPYDALDAVATSRLQDAYELLLLTRDGLDATHTGLPGPGPDLAAIADPVARRAALQDAILDSWGASGRSGQQGQLAPLPEQPGSLNDPTAVFLARVLIPATADNPPKRDGNAVLVDNWARRFVPSIALLGRWLGI
jgi:hypothetical protein